MYKLTSHANLRMQQRYKMTSEQANEWASKLTDSQIVSKYEAPQGGYRCITSDGVSIVVDGNTIVTANQKHNAEYFSSKEYLHNKQKFKQNEHNKHKKNRPMYTSKQRRKLGKNTYKGY